MDTPRGARHLCKSCASDTACWGRAAFCEPSAIFSGGGSGGNPEAMFLTVKQGAHFSLLFAPVGTPGELSDAA